MTRIQNKMTLMMCWVACACFISMAGEIHVAIDGSDSNAGTAAAPLQTLKAARDALRDKGWPGKEKCEVIIHAGTYRFTKPLRLSPSDSGSGNAPVVYRAAGDGKVIITGSQKLDAEWTLWKKGIYRTKTSKIGAIDQLFVNGERMHMARYPNVGEGSLSTKGKAGTPPYGGYAPDAWDAEKAAGWKDPKGAYMHAMHKGLWGGMHYRVLGKNPDGTLQYEGGWQNNRLSEPHKLYRMSENIFQELDAPGEWFHDANEGWLYYIPEEGTDLSSAQIEAVLQLKHLVELYGDIEEPVKQLEIPLSGNGLIDQKVPTPETQTPVKHIQIKGLTFHGTSRTFMETSEPILRSDWCLYRGGALHIRGTEDVSVENCNFEDLGGNAVFVDGYNRHAVIRGNSFLRNGASDVNIVGSPAAVRSPFFAYNAAVKLEKLDTAVGPKSEEYPEDCLVEDNFITMCGRFEKQTAGVNISMASRITVRHNTICHTPRAAINIADGCWGGHIIEWNDCFETVLETHDHGAFNSWGRDRFWLPAGPSGPRMMDESGRPLISAWVQKYPEMPRWDALQATILRHNRMHCDHGWDIDLDDGSTNYEIYNNLCISGGLKTREGYYRIVRNNIIFKHFTCNVPYPKPTYDIFESNIIWGRGYKSSFATRWGGVRNKTFFHNPKAKKVEPAIAAQSQTLDDEDSLYGNAQFIDPQNGDFNVAGQSPALNVGFKNFPMTGFGVTSPRLKAMASEPPIHLPSEVSPNIVIKHEEMKCQGATIKILETESELTATGMFDKKGVLLISVPQQSPLCAFGFKSDDVILELTGHPISSDTQLCQLFKTLKPGRHKARVWRNQESIDLSFEVE